MVESSNIGYIKLFRGIRDWGWYSDPNTFTVFVHLLIEASWREDSEWRGEIVKRGEVITSVARLSTICGLTEKQIRVCLDRLVKGGEIVKNGTNKYTKITICKYATYQDDNGSLGQANGEQMANEGQTKGEQRATSKEYKEYKEIKEDNKKEINKEKVGIVDALYSLYPTKCPVSGRATGKCSKNKRQIESLLKNRDASEVEFIIRDYITDCKNHNTYIKNFTTFLNQFPDKEQPRPSAQAQQPVPVQQKSPEVMAIEAMHAGASEQVVRQGILFAHEGISEERLNAALRNAGYLQ